MTDYRVLLIENAARLSVDHGRLRISRNDAADAFVAPADIALLCLHHHTVTVTTAVFRALASSGAAVLVTDDRHYPCALMLPIAANMAGPRRLQDQVRLIGSPLIGELWSQIVRARLRSEAANLRHFRLNGALRLERLASTVDRFDKSNAEAQGARHYWKYLFGTAFRRSKEGAIDGVNARLNYGYAVLRALVARQLVMAGLNTCLGLGHRRMDNPFNLADDFMEPFRYVVERCVRALGDCEGELTAKSKLELLGFMDQDVKINGQNYRLASAIAETVDSYCRVLERQGGELSLP